MISLLRPAIILSVLAVAACDEVAVSGGSGTSFAESRALKNCVRAVEKETGVKGAQPNTTLPVVEVNQYIIDVPNAKPWTCFTDDNGRAVELLEVRRA